MAGAEESLYDILGCGRNDDAIRIKESYQQKILTHHPDKGGDRVLFDKIKHAYGVCCYLILLAYHHTPLGTVEPGLTQNV